ncbi:diguanylate cyclase domain-containing protein [uncultured Cohaesibacter sp.]|uniref:diguanylate cyclase domain-containing protein n=1 Tax=uncultured Cohaesibacter sp. TaxID=1002546 RepID=UPI0029C9315C|nr:diguanylate cyclase [uncultured Cohaesibacter sp.]
MTASDIWQAIWALQHLAGVLNSSCREFDLPSRWGGEEFAILLRSADIDGARHFAERIRKSVANAPLYWDGSRTSA